MVPQLIERLGQVRQGREAGLKPSSTPPSTANFPRGYCERLGTPKRSV